MRDVFTMGARPIANMNALRFGAPDHPKTRHLVAGVVSGIGDYGNCMGVPTVGGETNFDPRYNDNILVNAMCVGLADANRIFKSAAKGVGHPVVYVGSKTGRDGIHGATMASAEFDEASEEKRPTVQVGDPFTEKLLLEACLELMAEDAIVAIQDMGAAGLTSSSVEMADKGGVGIELELDRVPTREEGMTAYEMMLSESQERMLMVLQAGLGEGRPSACSANGSWISRSSAIPPTRGTSWCAIAASSRPTFRSRRSPMPRRSMSGLIPSGSRSRSSRRKTCRPPNSLLGALEYLMGSPHLCSRRWIWEQYDHMVMADTVQRPGGDAAVVRVHGTQKGIAISCDVTPRYCAADPYRGRQAGGGGMLAQPHGRRRRSARHHRLHEFRQSRAAGDHGRVRVRRRRHGRGLHRARLPRRVGQCLALQRDQRHRHSADAGDRRHRAHPRHRGTWRRSRSSARAIC